MVEFSKDYQPERRGDPKKAGEANADRHLMSNAIRLALHRESDNPDDVDEGGKRLKKFQVIANNLVEDAVTGDFQTAKEVIDRVDGKAPQAIIHQGDEEKPITVIERVIVKPTD